MTPSVPRPQQPDPIDRLFERLPGPPRRSPRTAIARDRVGEATGAQATLETAKAQHGKRRGAAALQAAPPGQAGEPGAAGIDDPYSRLLGSGGYDVRHYDLVGDAVVARASTAPYA